MAAEARQLLGRLEATRLQPEKAWTVPEISALQPVRVNPEPLRNPPLQSFTRGVCTWLL